MPMTWSRKLGCVRSSSSPTVPITFLWDDVQGYPWRKVYGFYSKDSLEYLAHQRANRKALATNRAHLAIATVCISSKR